MPTYVKDSSNLISLPSGLETPFEAQSDYITPNDQFFVCSASDTPRIDAETWTMTVAGDGVGRAITLSYRDLMAMPHKTVAAYLECAGNHRRLFEDVLGEPLNRRPSMTEVKWGLGGVGMAEWSGVRLRDVLRQAKIRDSAYHVCPVGLDVGLEDADGIRVPMPVTKAMHPDTLIALTMNGDPLPPDHGFPARLIVPGWVGTYSIKWLGRIDVTTAHQWVYRNTELYVLAGRLACRRFSTVKRCSHHRANHQKFTRLTLASGAITWPTPFAWLGPLTRCRNRLCRMERGER